MPRKFLLTEIDQNKRWFDIASPTSDRRFCVSMKVIKGGRTQLELEAVAALLDPMGTERAAQLFARLKPRGELRCIVPSPLPQPGAVERKPSEFAESQPE